MRGFPGWATLAGFLAHALNFTETYQKFVKKSSVERVNTPI